MVANAEHREFENGLEPKETTVQEEIRGSISLKILQ